MLNEILAITGKPGLFRLLSRGNNMLVVESLTDGKRMPTFARDKIVSLADISMYTTGEDQPLSAILQNLLKLQDGKPIDKNIKQLSNAELQQLFLQVLPDYDQDRVYPSDIRKLFSWYNLLLSKGITDFTVKDDNAEEDTTNNE